MPRNDAEVMSAVSAFKSPVAATSNVRSPGTAPALDQKKAKKQASGREKERGKKKVKTSSETAMHDSSLSKGEDDHDDVDEDWFQHGERSRAAQHQYGTRRRAAATTGMTPTQESRG